MTKPYRTVIFYSGINRLRASLNEMGVKFTTRDVFSGFWGVQFDIEKPRGKGAVAKCAAINKLLEVQK